MTNRFFINLKYWTPYKKKRMSSAQQCSNDTTYDQILKNQVDLHRIDADYILVLLRTAIATNDTPFVSAIFSSSTPELLTIDDGGGVTLWHALRNNNMDIATMLVKAGVDLSQRHPNGSTLLHWMIKRIGDVDDAEKLVELMIECGADVNARDGMGMRILPLAIEIHAKSVVEMLLKYDADIEDDDVSRAAFGFRTADMLPMLLAACDVDTRKRRAMSALWCYLCCQPLEEFTTEIFDVTKPSDYYKDLSLIRTIVQYALFPQRSDLDTINILNPAVRLGHLDTVKIILEYKVDFRKEPKLGAQLLCFASKLHKSCIAKLLIERGADIHCSNDMNEGQYPLHEACRCNSVQNIHLFLSLGADINVKNRHGQTPFSLINTDSFTHHHQLFIKNIAILLLNKRQVNERDLNSIRNHSRMHEYYKECTLELHKMRETEICKDISYSCFFDKSLEELTDYVKRGDFIENYRTSRQKRRNLFPLYFTQIDDVFRIIERRKNFLMIRQKFFGDESDSGLSIKTDLEYVKQDFYFMLHDRINKDELAYDLNLLR